MTTRHEYPLIDFGNPRLSIFLLKLAAKGAAWFYFGYMFGIGWGIAR